MGKAQIKLSCLALLSIFLLQAFLLSACTQTTESAAKLTSQSVKTGSSSPPSSEENAPGLSTEKAPPPNVQDGSIEVAVPVAGSTQLNSWESFGEPVSIFALAINPRTPTTIYAGAQDGVFKSVDGGVSWEYRGESICGSVVDLEIDRSNPTAIYASDQCGNVYKSSDGGANWSVINSEQLTEYDTLPLVLDHQSQSTMYVGTYDGGVLKTTNGGGTWLPVNTGLPDTGVSVLEVDPLNSSTLYANTENSGLFKSTDSGSSWMSASAGLEIMHNGIAALVIDPQNPSTLYVGSWHIGTYKGGVFKSTDGGASWSRVSSGLPQDTVTAIAIDPISPTILYAGTWESGVYKSTNGGLDWFRFTDGLPQSPVHALAVDPLRPANIFAGLEDYGLFAVLGDKYDIAALPPSPVVALQPSPVVPSAVPAKPTWTVLEEDAFEYLYNDVIANIESLQGEVPFAGMTVAIRRPGKQDWVQGFGYADEEKSIPASPGTVYMIGTLTQQFTAAAVMQLVEMNIVDLDAQVSQYLDGLPPDIGKYASLGDLLSHRSGINETAETYELLASQSTFTSQDLLQTLIPTLERISLSAMHNSPGLGDYILLGLVIEKVTGMSYYDYLSENVIARADLQYTGFCNPSIPSVAKGYRLTDDALQPFQVNASAVYAGGGLCSTAGDMLQWTDALASGKVVQPASYHLMLNPNQSEETSDYHPGYGFIVRESPVGTEIIAFGNSVSYDNRQTSYPEKGFTYVVLSNTATQGSALGLLWPTIPWWLFP